MIRLIVELEACNQANPGVHKSLDPYELKSQ